MWERVGMTDLLTNHEDNICILEYLYNYKGKSDSCFVNQIGEIIETGKT